MKVLRFKFTFQDKIQFMRELTVKYENPIAVVCPHINLMNYYEELFRRNKKLRFYCKENWHQIKEMAVVFDEDYFFMEGRSPYLEVFYQIASFDIPIIGLRSIRNDFDYYPLILKQAYFNRLKYEQYFRAKPVIYIQYLSQLLRAQEGATIFVSKKTQEISTEAIEIMTGQSSVFRLGKGQQGFFSQIRAFYCSIPRIFFDTVIRLRLLINFH